MDKVQLKPHVFLTINGYSSVVVTPNEGHTHETWRKTGNEIADTYIQECIDGAHQSPGGRCEGVKQAKQFFERHAGEWNCTFTQGNTICNWLLVE